MASLGQRWSDLVAGEGSTRPVSLLRIALVGIMWAEWGNWLMLTKELDPEHVAHSLAFFAFSLLMGLGVWSRLTTFACAFLLYWQFYRFGVVLGEKDIVHHHTYFLMITTLLLSLTPCGGSYSFDRWRAVVRARAAGQPPPPERGPLWATALIRFQVSMIYFWGAVQKTTIGYLSGFRPQQIVMHHYTGADWPPFEGFALVMLAAGAGSAVLEYALAIGLWLRRLRPFLVPLGVAFHWTIFVTLPVGTFSVLICLTYLLFFDPDRVHRFVDELSGVDGARARVGPAG